MVRGTFIIIDCHEYLEEPRLQWHTGNAASELTVGSVVLGTVTQIQTKWQIVGLHLEGVGGIAIGGLDRR